MFFSHFRSPQRRRATALERMAAATGPTSTSPRRGPDAIAEATDAALYEWKKQRSIETSQDSQEKTEKVRRMAAKGSTQFPCPRVDLLDPAPLHQLSLPVVASI